MRIPKKLFQTAKSWDNLPSEIKENIRLLKERNPDWSYSFFDDSAVKAYLQEHMSDDDWASVERVNPKYGVVLADLFRYVVLCNEGGVYLDIKSTARRPLTDVIDPDADFVVSQWENRLAEPDYGKGLHPELVHVPGGEFQQWCIIAAPGNPFLKSVIKQVLQNFRNYTPSTFGTDAFGVLRLSGPIAYTKAIFPLLDHFPYKAVDLSEWGIEYTLYGSTGFDLKKHETAISDHIHYSRLNEPIVMHDIFIEPPQPIITKLGDLLAKELRENTELVLKLAVFSIASTLAFATALILVAVIALLD